MMNEILQGFHFIRPEWLYAFIPLAILVVLALRRQQTSVSWRSVCDEALLPHVLTSTSANMHAVGTWLAALAAALAIIAIAGPAWEKLPQPVFRDDSAVVVALDLSRSMDATDVRPTRLTRARLKILDILKQRGSGQTALLVYAADAFVVSPLTDDTDTIAHLVPTLETDIMPAQGSDTSSALEKAQQLLQQAGIQDGHIILLTDGISTSHLEKLSTVMTARHRLSIIGVGTEEGSPIPMTGGFLTDRSGSIVIPVLERTALRKAAASGGGLYRDMSNDDTDIEQILALTHDDASLDGGEQDLTADSWREEGPWLLLLALPLVALFARRGSVGIFLLVLLPVMQEAQAFELENLWRTADQRAMQAYEQGDTATAAETFNDPRWRASALYRQQQYDKAIAAAGEPVLADDFYNRGNALARLGQLEQALADYDRAIELDANNEDARYNRQLVEEALRKQQQQQNQNQQSSNQDQQEADIGQDEQSEQQTSQQKQQQGDDDEQQGSESESQLQDSAQQQQQDEQNQDPGQQAESSEQQAEQQAGQQDMQEAAHAREDQGADKEASNIEQASRDPEDEQARATEQWLQRIPDDPGGLLRRKFQYQYKQRGNASQEQQPW